MALPQVLALPLRTRRESAVPTGTHLILARPINPVSGYGQVSAVVSFSNCQRSVDLCKLAWGLLLARYTHMVEVAFGYAEVPTSIFELGPVQEALDVCAMTLAPDIDLRSVLREPLASPTNLVHCKRTAISAEGSDREPLATVLVTSNDPETEPPSAHQSSTPILGQQFIANLDRDALNTIAAMTSAPLVIGCQVTSGRLAVRIAFDRSIVADYAAEELVAQLCTVVRSLEDATKSLTESHPGMMISDMTWVDETERQRLLQFAGAISHPDAVRTPVHLLASEWALKTPDGIALAHEGRTVTYAEFNRLTSALARVLVRDYGARPEVRIALHLPNSIEFIVALFAVLKSGAAYVPIDPEYPDGRVRYIIEDSAASVVLTSSTTSDRLGAVLGGSYLVIDDLLATVQQGDRTGAPFVAHHSQTSDLAYIVYTSGTTGQPKGVMVEHGNLVNFAVDPGYLQYQGSGNRYMPTFSVGFDALLFPITRALCFGGTLIVPSTDFLGDLAGTHGLMTTPSFLAKLNPADLPALRIIFSGGESCTRQLVDKWSVQCHFVNGYGPSETTVTGLTASLTTDDPITAGRPQLNVLAYVVDCDLRLVPVGVPGQLLIGGLGVARGYCNRPDLTAQKFIANPFGPGRVYCTGDYARWLPNGHVDILGRMDQQVKLRGFRIELEEVEAAATSCPTVQLAVAAVQKDRLVLFVEPKSVDTVELFNHLRVRLAKFMVPDQIISVDHLSLTVNGKVDRKALPEVTEPPPVTASTGPHDLTDLELRLREAWAQVLQLPGDRIGPDDDFFRIGGDSIAAILLVSKCQQLGYKATVTLIYACRQLCALAARLTPLVTTTSEANQLQAQGPVALTPIQRWFFSLPFRNPHHFNQSFTLRVNATTTLDRVSHALVRLANHHDMLRARFSQTEEGVWTQYIPSPEAVPGDFVVVEATVAEADYADLILKVQSSLHLTDGPVMAAYLIHSHDEANRTRLFWTIHHALIDLVSWRVLIEDLQTLLVGGQLPPKTLSFQSWCHQLDGYARTLTADLWPSQVMAVDNRQRLAPTGDLGDVATAARLSVSYEFDPDFTTRLLLQLAPQWRVTPRDVLLATFAQAYCQTLDTIQVSFMMEGHGREPWSDDIDVSRTVGWFTALYPLVLDVPTEGPILAVLRHTKEALQQIPTHGFPYSLLRHMPSVDPAERAKVLSKTPGRLDVQFNYFGRFGASGTGDGAVGIEWDDRFGLHDFAPGEHVIFDLNPMPLVNRDCLRLVMEYNPRVYASPIANQLISRWRQNLEALVDHSPGSAQPLLTRFDAPLLQPTAEEWAALLADLEERSIPASDVEDILPCTAMQGGLLAATLKDPTAYVVQAAVTLSGRIQLDRLRKAWESLTQQHAILRTAFLTTSAARSHGFAQIVHQQPRLAWTAGELPLESLPEFFSSNRARKFVLHEPLVRVHFFPTAEATQYLMVLTIHHALVDGWSLPLILQELCRIYSSGPSPALAPTLGFHRVIEQVLQQDVLASRAFWTGYLSGSVPTPAPLLSPRLTGQTGFSEYARALSVRKADLRRAAHRYGVTLSTLLKAAYALVMARYLDRDDVLVGFVVSGRNLDVPGISTLIGPCLNTVVLRFRLTDQPLGQWLQQLQADATRMIPFEHTSLTSIHTWCGVDPSTPLFHTLLGHESFPVFDAPSNELTATLDRVHEFTEYPLAVDFVEAEGSLGIKVGYGRASYAETDVARLVLSIDGMLTALTQVDDDTNAQLLSLSPPATISPLEHPDLTAAAGLSDDQVSRIRSFFGQLADFADRPAVAGDNYALTYRQLLHAARKLASALPASDRNSPTALVVMVDTLAALATALVVTLYRGLTLIPVGLTEPLESVAHRCHMLDVLGIVGPRRLTDPLADILPADATIVDISEWTSPHGTEPPNPEPWSTAPFHQASRATLITGNAVLRSQPLADSLNRMPTVASLGGEPGCTLVSQNMPLDTPEASWVTLFALSWGLTVTGSLNENEGRVRSACRVTLADQREPAITRSPTILLCDLTQPSPSLYCNDPAEYTTCLGYLGSIFSGHTLLPAEQVDTRILPYGELVASVRLVDRRGHPCPPGMIGRIVIGTDNGAPSVVGFPHGSRTASLPAPTLGYVDVKCRTLHVLGSTDRLVTVGGLQFHLAALDQRLAAGGLPSPFSVTVHGTHLVTFTTASEGVAGQFDILCLNLPTSLVPSTLVPIVQYPHLLGAPEADLRTFARAYLTAATDPQFASMSTVTDRWLAVTCLDLVVRERVGPSTADELWAGLISSPVRIHQLCHRVRQRFGVTLDFPAILTCADLSALARAIKLSKITGPISPPFPLPDSAVVLRTGPLSPYQEQVWQACQLSPTPGAFYFQTVLTADLPLITGLVRKVVKRVVREVAELRVVVRCHGGHLQAALLAPWGATVKITELDPGTTVEAYLEARHDHLNLHSGSLFGVELITTAEGKDTRHLVIRMHQLLGTETLIHRFGRELMRTLCTQREGPRKPADVRLHDGHVAIPDPIDVVDADLSYWQTLLSACPTELDLPYDRSRPALPTFQSVTSTFNLESTMAEQVLALASTLRHTAGAVWLALTAAYLTRIGSGADILLDMGVPLEFSQGNADKECLSGQSVPVRVKGADCTAGVTDLCNVLVRQLDESIARANPATDVYRPLLASTSTPGWHPVRVGVTACTDDSRPAGQFSMAATHTVLWQDVQLTAFLTQTAPSVVVRYNPDLFDPATVQRLVANFIHFAQCLLLTDAPLTRAPLVTPAEERRLLDEFSRNPCAYDPLSPASDNPVNLFLNWVTMSPETVALELGDWTETYASLEQKARSLAAALRRHEIQDQDRVAVVLANTPASAVAILAVWLVHAVYVPIDAQLPEQRQRYMVKAAQCSVVLNVTDDHSVWPDALDGLALLQANHSTTASQPEFEYRPLDLAYIVFTSGTTGLPKGVMINHAGLSNVINSPEVLMLPHARLRCIQTFGVGFDAALFVAVNTVCHGCTLVFPGDDLAEALRQVDAAIMTPTLLASLDPCQYPNLRYIKTGGEILPTEVADRWLPRCTVLNMYGPSEITMCSHVKYAEPGKQLTIGRPISGSECYILDVHRQLVPIGIVGEMYIGGIGVSAGYVNRPELNVTKFIDLPYSEGPVYATGDLGRWLPNGDVEMMGRRDDQVKLRGFRIELQEIEAALLSHPMVKQAAALVVDRRQLYAFVSPDTASPADLLTALQARLPAYMIPRRIFTRTALQLTSNGKVDKRALADLAQAAIQVAPPATGPGDAAGQLLSQALAATLNLPETSVDLTQSFFHLGGDSISAIRLSSQLASRGVKVPVPAIVKAGSLVELMDLIRPGGFDPATTTSAYRLFSLLALDAANQGAVVGRAAQALGVEATSVQDVLPVSSLQLGFLVNTLKDPSAYMVQIAYGMAGPLDVGRLHQSWQQTAADHAILRTKFVVADDFSAHSFLQVTLDQCDIEWAYHDQKGADVSTLETAHFSSDRQRGFDFTGPLLRLALVRVDTDQHILFFTFHHALLDAWSVELILADTLSHYHAIRCRPPTQFHDFIAQLTTDSLEQAERFWRTTLAGVKVTPAIQFPSPPTAQDTELAHHTHFHPLDPPLADIQHYCHRQGVTVNTLLLALWALTLARYAQVNDEVTFGTLVSGRSVAVPGIESMAGLCINTIPFRAHLPAEGSLSDFVREIGQHFLALSDYEQASLVDIQRWANLPVNAPLFDTLLVYDNFQKAEAATKDGLKYIPRSGQNFTEYAYTAHFSHDHDRLNLRLTVQGVHSDTVYVGYMAQFINHCLVELIEGRAVAFADVLRLPLREHEQIQRWSAGNTVEFPQRDWMAPQLFTQNLATRPSAVALEAATGHFTYAEVYRRTCSIAADLRAKGFQPGDAAALIFTRCPEFIFSFFAVLLLGGVCVPMDAHNAPGRLRYMVELLDDPWLISITNHAEVITASALPVPATRQLHVDALDFAAEHAPAFQPDTTRQPDDLMYIMFTSGTTGQPKGVQIRHRSLVNFVLSRATFYRFTPDIRYLLMFNIAFDASLNPIFSTFYAGGTLVLLDGDLLQTLGRVNTINTTPSVLAAIDPLLYPNLTTVVVGGESLPYGVAHAWSAQARVFNMYGPTEVTIDSHGGQVNPGEPISVGRTLANAQCHIVDADMRPVPVGVTGEIFIGGAGLALGYWKQPDLTAQAFILNPFGSGRLYRTGDLGCWLPNGEVCILGRQDHQVKLRGFRIELGEIESTCQMYPGVSGAVALVRESRLVAYVAPGDLDVASLRRHLTAKLPAYMVPDNLLPLETIPLTSVGKTDRRALLALPLPEGDDELDIDDESDPSVSYVALKSAVMEVLGVGATKVRTTASFFRLGGDSVSAIRLATALRNRGYVVTVAQVFEHNTLGALSEVLHALQPAESPDEPYRPFSLLGSAGLEPDAVLPVVAGTLGVESSTIQDILPPSSLQLGFLLSTLRDPSAYMVQESFDIDGDLDVDRLRRSWQDTASAHVILRTKFVEASDFSDHPFLQVVMDRAEVEWTSSDTTEEDLAAKEADYFTCDRQRGFELHGPLVRLALFRVGAARHVLFLTFHHALLDAWSVSIVKAETLERYHVLPTQVRTQYPAYLAQALDVDQAAMREFWRTTLDNAKWHPAVHFPLDHHSDRPGPSSVSHTINLALDTIRNFCVVQGITFNSLLRTVWALTLARYLGEEEEVTFGVLTSGRNLPVPGIEGMVGMCINTLPFRARLRPATSLLDLAQRINHESGALTAHEQCGLIDIKKWASVAPEVALFHTLLVYDHHLEYTPAASVTFDYQPRTGRNAAEYAHVAHFTETDDQLGIYLTFQPQYCDADYAQLICQLVEHCLTAMVANPHGPVDDSVQLPRAERALVDQWSAGTTALYPQREWLAPQLFTQNLDRRPHAVALESSAAQYSYLEVYQGASMLAGALLTRGFQAGNTVALVFTRCTEFVISYLAVQLLGGVCAAMDAGNSPDRIRYMLELLDHPLVVSTSQHASLITVLELCDHQIIFADLVDGPAKGQNGRLPPLTRTPDDLVYIVFTSGTTGRPKGVQVTHRSAVNYIMAANSDLGLDSSCRFLQAMNLSFDPVFKEMFCAFHAGGAVVVHEGELDEDLRRANICILVPSVIAVLDPHSYPNLTTLMAGGEPLPPAVAEKWSRVTVLYNFYGPSEATIASHRKLMLPGDKVTIGATFTNVQCHILDDRLRPVPIGLAGEICIGGAGVSGGYWKQPGLTDQAFVANPFGPGRLYRTGDLGCWLPNGEVQVFGRRDHQVKLRGFRIELGEIETACQTHPGVVNAVALVKEKRLVAYVTPSAVNKAELRRSITSRLPHYMVPEVIVSVETLPLTPIGKTDRRALQAIPLPPEVDDDVIDDQPLSDTFATLRRALAETLNVDPNRVVPSASFLRLGGDSISAIQFSSRCKKYGLKLTVADVLKHPILSQLEQRVELVDKATVGKASMDACGPTPLTAIERQIIPGMRHVNHFNQSFLLKCREPLTLDMLREAVRALVIHHDMLRVRLAPAGDEWHKEVLPLPTDTATEAFLARFAAVTEASLDKSDYEAWTLNQQQSIDVERGPVMACTLLTVNDQPHVYLAIHHLVVDFVSWRILLEDLESVLLGHTLPEKTTSFREWSTLVNAYAQTLPSNQWPDHGPTCALPIDFDGAPIQPVTYRTLQTVQQTLGRDLTEALYDRAAGHVDASPEEFLVAALLAAVTAKFNLDSLEMQMEGHGRRPWRSEIDISRTVGWFTSVYPASFHLGQAEHYSSLPTALRLLAHVKERLRSTPDHGFPYGLHRYLRRSKATGAHSGSPPSTPSDIVFNYSGRFEQLQAADAFWSPVILDGGWSHDLSLDELVGHALSATCDYHAHDGLVLSLQYSTLMYHDETVGGLASLWRQQLVGLITLATSSPQPCRTPADYPLTGLSEAAWGKCTRELLPRLHLTPVDVDNLYPCLPLQEGLLLATLKDPAAYMVQSSYSIRGPLDVPRFQKAWDSTAQHHATFRTRFLLGLPDALHPNLQLVVKSTATCWAIEDWSTHDVERAEANFLSQEREAGFSPERPLIRFGLFHLGEGHHRLIVSLHHAIADGWSNGLYTQTWLRCYANLELQPAGQLQDLVTYVQSQGPREAEQFWHKQFAGVETPSLLAEPHHTPGTSVSPAEAKYYGAVMRTVDSNVDFARLAQSFGVTLSSLLRATVGLVLHRHSGSSDSIFGAVVSGRNAPVPQVESIVGACINTLPCRVRVDHNPTVGDLLRTVHEDSIAAYRYEHCSLTDIHRWSGLSPEQPLFNVLFIYENYPETVPQDDLPIALELVDCRDPTDVPLTLMAVYSDAQLHLKASYQSHAFSESFIGGFLDHAVNVLHSLGTHQPDQSVHALEMLSPRDLSLLTDTWARNPQPLTSPPALDEFWRHVHEQPNRNALRDQERTLTYAELDRATSYLAQQIQQAGAGGPDRVVAVLADNSPELIMGQLAAWKTNAAFVVIAPDYPIERKLFIIRDTACAAVVGRQECLRDLETQPPLAYIPIVTVERRPLEATVDLPPVSVQPNHLAYVIYTSGSTGQPKGVMVSHGALANYLAGFHEVTTVTPTSVVPTILAPTFDVSVSEIWTTLTSGGTVAIARPGDYRPALTLATRASFTPSLLALFDPADYPNLTSVLVVGEACPQSLVDKWAPYAEFINLYGPTEVTIATHHAKLKVGDLVAIGRPMPNAVGLILDDHLRPVPVGVTGHLYLGGKGLARGYLNRPDLTEQKFPTWPTTNERLYQSGDLARWLPDGQIECLGRIDNQVKVRGFRVELGEIETALEAHPAVTQACVVIQDTHLVGYICPPVEGDSRRLLDVVRACLPHYMVPSALVGLQEFPRTQAGKIDRTALPRHDFSLLTTPRDLATLAPVERQLVQIVAGCLRCDVTTVALDATFYQLGGNSLSAIQAVSHCQSQGLRVLVADFNRSNTLRHIARLAQSTAAPNAGDAVIDEALPATGPARLTPAQREFFGLSLTNPQWLVLPAMYETRDRFTPDQWQAAVDQVVRCHPLLRARFLEDPTMPGGMTYKVEDELTDQLTYHRVADREAVTGRLRSIVEGLDYLLGPISEFHVFDVGVTQYLFYCAHHLVTDYLSSKIVADDLAEALQGRTLEAPRITSQAWAEHQHLLAQRIDLNLLMVPPPLPALPSFRLNASASGADTGMRNVLLSRLLSSTLTRTLLTAAVDQLGASPLDIIVTALFTAYRKVFTLDTLGLAFLTHGRQPLDSQVLDLSRAVGFFAHHVPVVLSAPTEADSLAILRSTQRTLATGIDDGLLLTLVRRLRHFDDAAQRQRYEIDSPFSFSYLANTEALNSPTMDSAILREQPDMLAGLDPSLQQTQMPFVGAIVAKHIGNQLQLTIIGLTGRVSPDLMEQWLSVWSETLYALLPSPST